eukprot:3751462-Pleurochrysis_carterae.AAC.1
MISPWCRLRYGRGTNVLHTSRLVLSARSSDGCLFGIPGHHHRRPHRRRCIDLSRWLSVTSTFVWCIECHFDFRLSAASPPRACSQPKKAPTVTASERLQAIQQAQAGAEQHLSEITAGLRSLEGGGDGGGGGGNGSGGGGAGIAFAPMDRDDDSPSDSDSDGGNALGISHAQNGGGGSAFYADFRNSQLQRERERQEAERRQQDAARAAEERARQRAATIERERAAERARHADDNGEIDMLGQSSAMADFESDAMGFGIDPYGNL